MCPLRGGGGITQTNTSLLSTVEVQWNDASQKTAKAVNNLLHNKSFRDYLKLEVLKAFDGDYDALVSKVVHDYQTGNYNWNATQMQVLANASTSFPLMQIAIQVSPNIWNTGTIPNIVWIDADWDEARKPQISGYDKNGNIIVMNGTVTPTAPTVIISRNERGFIACDDLQYYRYSSVCEGCPRPCEVDDSGGGGSGGGGTGGDNGYNGYVTATDVSNGTQGDSLDEVYDEPLKWYRQNYKYESIYSMYFGNLNNVEGWPAGAPEVKVHVYEQNALDSMITLDTYRGGVFEPSKRKDINDKWWDCGVKQMHLWQWYTTGSEIKYAFYEYDDALIDKAEYEKVSDYVVGILDSVAVLDPLATSVIKVTLGVTGLFLKKDNDYSEYIGEMLISAHNNAIEFGIATGDFKFKSKPF